MSTDEHMTNLDLVGLFIRQSHQATIDGLPDRAASQLRIARAYLARADAAR